MDSNTQKNEKKFKSLLGMAKSMQSIDHDRADFWRGFSRGIRRLFHGENFGTAEEHEQWLNCRSGKFRKQLQTGYRVGFYYDQLKIESENDIRPLRKLLGLSVDDISEVTGVSARTVEGWEQGRPISGRALELIKKYFMK